MAKITLKTLTDKKQSGEKFASLTAYDATMAHLVSSQGVEVILVGDSLGNVIQGKNSTVPVTVDNMCYHTRCVSPAAGDAMVVADMPFASYATENDALIHAAALMQAGAEVVKIEGESWLCPVVTHLKRQGIPTCVHMGLTPQFVNVLGGYRVQGRETEKANRMIQSAVDVEAAGAAMLVLECVPADLAREITRTVSIPVIGIGAGKGTDAQVLVVYDMLNLTEGRKPKFVKNFMSGCSSPQDAVARYVSDVKRGTFPAQEHTFQ